MLHLSPVTLWIVVFFTVSFCLADNEVLGCAGNTIAEGFEANFFSYPNTGSGFDATFFTTGYKKIGTYLGSIPDVTNINFNTVPRNDSGYTYGFPTNFTSFSMELQGFFRAPQTGIYTFSLQDTAGGTSFQFGRRPEAQCDQEFNTMVSSELLIDRREDGSEKRTKQFFLQEGAYYPLRMLYYRRYTDSKLDLAVTLPDGSQQTEFQNVYQLEPVYNFESISSMADSVTLKSMTSATPLPFQSSSYDGLSETSIASVFATPTATDLSDYPTDTISSKNTVSFSEKTIQSDLALSRPTSEGYISNLDSTGGSLRQQTGNRHPVSPTISTYRRSYTQTWNIASDYIGKASTSYPPSYPAATQIPRYTDGPKSEATSNRMQSMPLTRTLGSSVYQSSSSDYFNEGLSKSYRSTPTTAAYIASSPSYSSIYQSESSQPEKEYTENSNSILSGYKSEPTALGTISDANRHVSTLSNGEYTTSALGSQNRLSNSQYVTKREGSGTEKGNQGISLNTSPGISHPTTVMFISLTTDTNLDESRSTQTPLSNGATWKQSYITRRSSRSETEGLTTVASKLTPKVYSSSLTRLARNSLILGQPASHSDASGELSKLSIYTETLSRKDLKSYTISEVSKSNGLHTSTDTIGSEAKQPTRGSSNISGPRTPEVWTMGSSSVIRGVTYTEPMSQSDFTSKNTVGYSTTGAQQRSKFSPSSEPSAQPTGSLSSEVGSVQNIHSSKNDPRISFDSTSRKGGTSASKLQSMQRESSNSLKSEFPGATIYPSGVSVYPIPIPEKTTLSSQISQKTSNTTNSVTRSSESAASERTNISDTYGTRSRVAFFSHDSLLTPSLLASTRNVGQNSNKGITTLNGFSDKVKNSNTALSNVGIFESTTRVNTDGSVGKATGISYPTLSFAIASNSENALSDSKETISLKSRYIKTQSPSEWHRPQWISSSMANRSESHSESEISETRSHISGDHKLPSPLSLAGVESIPVTYSNIAKSSRIGYSSSLILETLTRSEYHTMKAKNSRSTSTVIKVNSLENSNVVTPTKVSRHSQDEQHTSRIQSVLHANDEGSASVKNGMTSTFSRYSPEGMETTLLVTTTDAAVITKTVGSMLSSRSDSEPGSNIRISSSLLSGKALSSMRSMVGHTRIVSNMNIDTLRKVSTNIESVPFTIATGVETIPVKHSQIHTSSAFMNNAGNYGGVINSESISANSETPTRTIDISKTVSTATKDHTFNGKESQPADSTINYYSSQVGEVENTLSRGDSLVTELPNFRQHSSTRSSDENTLGTSNIFPKMIQTESNTQTSITLTRIPNARETNDFSPYYSFSLGNITTTLVSQKSTLSADSDGNWATSARTSSSSQPKRETASYHPSSANDAITQTRHDLWITIVSVLLCFI